MKALVASSSETMCIILEQLGDRAVFISFSSIPSFDTADKSQN